MMSSGNNLLFPRFVVSNPKLSSICGESKTNMLKVSWLYLKECVKVRFAKNLIINDSI